MAFKKVELDEEDMKSSGRAFEKFSAIGDKRSGVWLRTEKQTKTFNPAEGPKTVNVHILWWPGGARVPGGEVRPAEDYEITGYWGLDAAIEKAKKPESEGGLGLKDDAGHLVRLTYAKDLPTAKGAARMFTVEADTEYPTNPKAKLPPGFKGGAKPAAPDEDDIPF